MATDYNPMDEPDVRAAVEERIEPMNFREMLDELVGFSGVALSARFLWLPFVEHHGCVLLPWVDGEAGIAEWSAALAGDVSALESMLNHLHLWELFPDGPDDGLVALGETLVKTWSAALAEQFPDRAFEVFLRNDESGYGPTVYLRSR